MQLVKDRIWLIGLVVLAPVPLGLLMPMVGNVIAEQLYGSATMLKAMEQFFNELFVPESMGFFAFNVFPFALYSVFSLIKLFTLKYLDGSLAQWGGALLLASVACALVNFLNLKVIYLTGSSVLFLVLYPVTMFPALMIGHYVGRALWRVSGGDAGSFREQ